MRIIPSLAVAAALAVSTSAYAQSAPTLAEVRADPDNIALNVAYAQGRIAAGDRQAALPALERVLLINPSLDDVRLIYARNLYILGDFEGAERELRLLEGRLPEGEARARDDLLARATARSKAFRGRAQLYTGLRFADDPSLGFGGDDDLAAIVGAELRVEQEIAGTGGGYAFGEIELRGEAHTEADGLDGFEGRLAAGLSLPYGDLTFEPYLFARTDLLDNGERVRDIGGGLAFTYAMSERSELSLGVEVTDRDFDDGSVFGRDGDEVSVRLGFAGKATANLAIYASVEIEEYDAVVPAFDYDGWTARVGADYDLSSGMRLIGRYGYRERDFLSGREDELQDAYLGLTAPVAWGGAKDLSVQAGVRHEWRRSTNPLLDGDTTTVEVLLIRGFSF